MAESNRTFFVFGMLTLHPQPARCPLYPCNHVAVASPSQAVLGTVPFLPRAREAKTKLRGPLPGFPRVPHPSAFGALSPGAATVIAGSTTLPLDPAPSVRHPRPLLQQPATRRSPARRASAAAEGVV